MISTKIKNTVVHGDSEISAHAGRASGLTMPTYIISNGLSRFQRLLNTYPEMLHTVSKKMDLLYAKQEALESFLKFQRKRFYDPDRRKETQSLN